MKLFIISDIHGFYDEMIDSLKNAGFDKDNLNHYHNILTIGVMVELHFLVI